MIQTQLLTLTFVAVRLAGLFLFCPVFNDGRIPRLVKIGLVLSLGWMFAFSGNSVVRLSEWLQPEHVSVVRLVIAVAVELLFGAGLGFALGIVIEPARIAGAYIGQELGLTMAATTDPSTRRQTNIVTQVFEGWAIVLFFMLNLHVVVLQIMKASFLRFPVGQTSLFMPAPDVAFEADLVTKWGLSIASPVALCMFMTIMGLAILMRAVPQMNIFSIGLALRLSVGITSMLVFLPSIMESLRRVMLHAEDVMQLLF